MNDYVVNKTIQFGIKAESPEEAVKLVLGGEGDQITVQCMASPRPPQMNMGSGGSPKPAQEMIKASKETTEK